MRKTKEGRDAARCAPTSYLSSRCWPGPPQPHWPSPRLVPVTGSEWAPFCPTRWPSSPGSCCWSSALWSAGAVARGPVHPGPYQQASEAGWAGGGKGEQSARQPALLPLLLPTAIRTSCHQHFSVYMTLLPTLARSLHTRHFLGGVILRGFCVSVIRTQLLY